MDDQERVQPLAADLEIEAEDLEVKDDASEAVKGGEAVTFNYGTIQVKYTQQDGTGSSPGK